jgi:hypothetical protein
MTECASATRYSAVRRWGDAGAIEAGTRDVSVASIYRAFALPHKVALTPAGRESDETLKECSR